MNIEETRNINRKPRVRKIMELNLIEIDIPRTQRQAVSGPNQCNWKKAIESELKSHEDNKR